MTRIANAFAPVLLATLAVGCQMEPQLGQLAQEASAQVLSPAWADAVHGEPNRIADVAEHAVQAVVHISAAKRVQATNLPPMLGGGRQGGVQRGSGSGVLVDPSGLILTNNHVVEGADSLEVQLSDGRTFPATLRGTDPATDLAILELGGDVSGTLPVLPLGDSENARLGEVVLAIGNPFGLQGTVTMGIVSATGRNAVHLAEYENFIQTDAAINPGNSGGALVNLRGELIGINTAIHSRSGGYDGIGFAIPSNLSKDIMTRLLRDGRVVRGYLGIAGQDLSASHAEVFGAPSGTAGVVVSHVEPGSAADEAGLKTGDVITALDGTPIQDWASFRNEVALSGADTRIQMAVVRNGRTRTLSATLAEKASRKRGAEVSSESPEASALLEGVRLMDIDAEARAQTRIPGDWPDGLYVAEVAPGSDAAVAGLRVGDVIIEVNRVRGKDPTQLRRSLRGAGPQVLLVFRDGVERYVFLN
jgi:serine protease Do